MDIGPSEAETFRTSFLRKLTRRGLRGVELVISDAHEGLKAAVAKVLNATWQRCRVHFMRNALSHAGKSKRHVASAFIATAFAQNYAVASRAQWRKVADQLRLTFLRLVEFMDVAETEVLTYKTFPKEGREDHPQQGRRAGAGEVARAASAMPAGSCAFPATLLLPV